MYGIFSHKLFRILHITHGWEKGRLLNNNGNLN